MRILPTMAIVALAGIGSVLPDPILGQDTALPSDQSPVVRAIRESDSPMVTDRATREQQIVARATTGDTGHILTVGPRTSSRYLEDPFVRAGCPQSISRWAIPSILGNQYSAGYVGGGVPLLGEGRYAHEGTWGLDYDGLLPKRIWLHWTHGRRCQGGTAGYETDGPKLRRSH